MNFKLTLIFFALFIFKLNAQFENKKSDFTIYTLTKNKIEKSRDSTFEIIKLIKYDIQNTILDSKKNMFQYRLDSLRDFMENFNLKDVENEFNLIKNNNTYIDAPNLLLYRLHRREGLNLFKEIKNLYNHLSKEVQSSEKGKELNQALIDYSNSNVGSLAPKFYLKDINNNEVSLVQFYNKNYVLIDFWASWCAPCREDFPYLKTVSSKYKELKIISISKDDNLNFWRNAILKDKTESWIHISTRENNFKIEKEYFVTAIPVKILIDKNGLIIGRWRGGGEENKLDIENKLKEIFEKN